MNKSGSNALTGAITGIIKEMSAQPPIIDFGIINSDYSLTLNSFPKPVPKADYSVCRQLLYEKSVELTTTYNDGGHDHAGTVPYETHTHKVKLPVKMERLKAGDKVLVAIIQNELVVIDKVYGGKYLNTKGEPEWG